MITDSHKTEMRLASASTPIAASMYGGTVPSNADEHDANPVELGVRFKVGAPGLVTAIRYYKSAANSGAHTATLWSGSGKRLATANFKTETRAGWQTVSLAHPIRVEAGQTYVASYHTNTGHYAQQIGAFRSHRTIGASYVKGIAGVYHYGRTAFPRDTWRDSSYFVDVAFQLTSSPTTPAPTRTAPTSPATPPASSHPNPPASTPPTSSVPPTSAPPTTTPPPSSSTPTPPPSGGTFNTHPAAGVPAGTSLSSYTGPSTITKDGTVIDSKIVTQSLEIAAHNVTIKNSRFQSGDGEAIHVSGSATITDTTISSGENGIGGDNYSATRVEVTKLSDDGFKLGNNVHVDQSWCHDMTPTAEAHADCGQMQAGVTNMSVTNSWFDGGRNSALFIAPDLGPSSNGPVRIDNNVLGNGNYSLYCVDGNNGQYVVKNITITNNRFLDTAQYGPATINVPVNASNNTWFSSGKPVSMN